MALSVPLTFEVCLNDIASKIIDSEAGPQINLGLCLKVSVAELLQTLQQFQQKSKEIPPPAPKAKAEPKEAELAFYKQKAEASLAAAVPTGLVTPAPAPPAPSPTGPAPGTAQPAQAAEDSKGLPEARAAPKLETMTWEREIVELQPGREEYTAKSRWETASSTKNWILNDEAVLLNTLKISRLKSTPLLPKGPSTEPKDIKLLQENAAAIYHSALAAPVPEATPEAKAVATLASAPPPPPAAAPPAPGLVADAAPAAPASAPEVPAQGSKAEEPRPPLPASAPPPPPAARAAGSGSGSTSDAGGGSSSVEPPAQPPPGLAPPSPAGRAAPPAGRGGGAGADGKGADGKECKQQ